MNGERQLHSACQVSCSQPLWHSLPPHLISSPSMSLHSLPCQSSSPVRNRLSSSDKINDKGEITWYACELYTRMHRGPTRNLRAGPTMRYGQIYIVALAQIHCTISCLASRLAIKAMMAIGYSIHVDKIFAHYS